MSESIPLGNIQQPGDSERTERRDAAANRVRILEVADRLFAEHGVENVNMADIAAAAGVGKGTLYRRFGSKAELCLSLMDTQLQQFQERQLEALRQMTMSEAPKLEQLAHFLDALVAFTARHMPLLCEVQQQSQQLDEAEVERPHFWQYMTVHGLLQAAVNGGELPGGLDTTALAEALLAPLGADTFRFQARVLGLTPERVSAGLRTLVMGLQQLAEQD
jgi:AcrR family transcriptional regulator